VFTSLSLAKELKKNITSLVGTMSHLRRELPLLATDTTFELYSTKMFRHDDFTLTYRWKPFKNVVILSSMHSSVAVGSDHKQKSETIQFYNETSVDVIDQINVTKVHGKGWIKKMADSNSLQRVRSGSH